MPKDHIQIEVESKNEKCFEKKEEKDEQLDDVDRGKFEPARKNISRNPVLHSKTKHVDVRHHFIHDLVEDKVISLEFVSLEGQIVDILAKPLDVSRFDLLRKFIDLCTLC